MNTQPVTVSRRSSVAERENALCRLYWQVLERQPYSHERRCLAKLEQEFLSDKIGVRRFLKLLGQSEVYLNAFYFRASNVKFIEWNFKHFLGRAPSSSQEVGLYVNLLVRQGVPALMTALLDSEEYRKTFGCFTVPYSRSQPHYESPKAYLESHILNHERVEQRGHIVPTLYWHELGLDCGSGVCRYPDADEPSASARSRSSNSDGNLQTELLELLKAIDLAPLQQFG